MSNLLEDVFHIKTPRECFGPDGEPNIEHIDLGMTLTDACPKVKLLFTEESQLVKLVALVCEESYVTGSHFVCIEATDTNTETLEQRRAPLVPPIIHYKERKYLDVIPPGPSQKVFRVWYAPEQTSRELIHSLIPNLTVADCKRGLTLNTRERVSYYDVSNEIRNGVTMCPLGFVIDDWVKRKVREYPLKRIIGADNLPTTGYIVPQSDAEEILDAMIASIRDPRPDISLKTFSIRATCDSKQPWVLCARVHLFYSTIF
jgi:hypothetical protein